MAPGKFIQIELDQFPATYRKFKEPSVCVHHACILKRIRTLDQHNQSQYRITTKPIANHNLSP